MSYKIVTDSACDLSQEMCQQLDLAVAPMAVLYKGESRTEYTEA